MQVINGVGVKTIRLKSGLTLEIHGDAESLYIQPTVVENYGPKPMQITASHGKLYWSGIDLRRAVLDAFRFRNKRKEQT